MARQVLKDVKTRKKVRTWYPAGRAEGDKRDVQEEIDVFTATKFTKNLQTFSWDSTANKLQVRAQHSST